MTIIRAEQPLTYPKRHDHQHAGRVAWWLRGPESWGCVFERGPAAEPAPGVDSAGAKPESLEFSDSCPDKTHFPTRSQYWQSVINAYAAERRADVEQAVRTLVLTPTGAFWRTQDASGEWVATPVASEINEALQSPQEPSQPCP